QAGRIGEGCASRADPLARAQGGIAHTQDTRGQTKDRGTHRPNVARRSETMPVERASGGTSLIDVLDRVLDKGIVIDAWVRVSLVGIDLITVEARVVVASIDTYLKYSEAVGQAPAIAPKGIDSKTHEALLAENASLKAQLASASGVTERRRRRTE